MDLSKTTQPPLTKKELEATMQTLTLRQRMVFALHCSTKMLRNYRVFSERAKWGDYEQLCEAVEQCWSWVANDYIPQAKLREMFEKCEPSVPDLDEIDEEFATWGQDASIAVLHMLQVGFSHSVEPACNASEMCIQAVDAWIQITEDIDPADPDLERKILSHDLMQCELSSQREVL